MQTLDEKVKKLPTEIQREVLDYVDFLCHKYMEENTEGEQDDWMRISKSSLDSIWNNDEDDVYHDLLTSRLNPLLSY